MRMLSRNEARRFYDKFGAKQDRQGFYEDPAFDALIELGKFSEAQNVFEFGCGTGRLAATLLANHLPASAHYVGIDLSSTMVQLANDRLAPFGDRQEVILSDGGFEMTRFGGPFDRIVTTYVLDLLSPNDIQQFLAGAHSATSTRGLLCHAGLSKGTGAISMVTSSIWTLIHHVNPALVGGCRPLKLIDFLPPDQWRLVERRVVSGAGIPSEVIIVEAMNT
jgi:SAM-dependent methyltransferase